MRLLPINRSPRSLPIEKLTMQYIEAVLLTTTPFVVFASLAGFLPRVGPTRAISISLSSRFARNILPVSIRHVEVGRLRSMTKSENRQKYNVVVGPVGYGKSTLIRTATQKMFGVVSIKVSAGTSAEAIIDLALRKVSNFRIPFMHNPPSTERVIWWYNLFAKHSPLVIIKVLERGCAPFADISSAARIITEKYGLRLIIHGNSY